MRLKSLFFFRVTALAPTTGLLLGSLLLLSPETNPSFASSATSPIQSKKRQSGLALSPAYDIYIGFNMGTRSCGYENPGGFKRLAWVSTFLNVRFTAPPTGWSGKTPFESEIASGQDTSITELADYAFCWTWEGDKKYECFVTNGPNPFEAHLSLYEYDPSAPGSPQAWMEEAEKQWMVMIPPVTDPLDRGPDLYLEYSIDYPMGAPPEKRVILRAGDGHLGDCAVFGGPEPWLPRVIIPISWQRVMKGQEFSKEFGGTQEDYTHWGENPGLKWTVRFVPPKTK